MYATPQQRMAYNKLFIKTLLEKIAPLSTSLKVLYVLVHSSFVPATLHPSISLPFLFSTYFIHLFPCVLLFFFLRFSFFLQLHFLQSHKFSCSLELFNSVSSLPFSILPFSFFYFLCSVVFSWLQSLFFLSSFVILLRLSQRACIKCSL